MKLIFVNRFFHPDLSATSQILSDLAFHLAARPGNEVVVVTSRQRYDVPGERLASRESVDGVTVRRVWTTRFGRAGLPGRTLDYLTFYLSAGWRLWREVRSGDVVVALTDPPLISVVAAAVARGRRARWVDWVQDVFPEIAQGLGVRVPAASVLRRLRDGALRGAAANVVLGERMAQWARARGLPAERVMIIANWADERAIRPVAPGQNRLRADWGLAGKFVVGYSGNLGRAHDFRTALDAAEELRAESDVVFLFIGGGYHRDAVLAAAQARGLGNVLWMPYQPRHRLAESLSVPNVHWLSLLPALEGLIVPSKLYGALAAGRPAVMIGDTDGEVARLLERHDCGWTFGVGEGEQLASAIRRLRDAPALCEAMGRRARDAAETTHAMARGLEAWRGVLTTVSR